MNAPATTGLAPAYRDSFEHLADELRWLDLLICRRVAQFRESLRALERAATGQHMYISHDEVDWLLGRAPEMPEPTPTFDDELIALRTHIDARLAQNLRAGSAPMLLQLAQRFHLSPMEQQAVVVCLAPELDPKYDKLYAYLQDDVTRKRPSVRLVLELLCFTQDERWRARALFGERAALLHAGVLQTVDDAASPSGSSDLARFLRLEPCVLGFILGSSAIDGRLKSALSVLPTEAADDVALDETARRRLQALVEHHLSSGRQLVVNLHGAQGVGRRELAFDLCRRMGWQLLCLDLEQLPEAPAEAESLLRLALCHSLLWQAPIYIDNLDPTCCHDQRGAAWSRRLANAITQYSRLAFVASTRPWRAVGLFERSAFHALKLVAPGLSECENAWRRELRTRTTADSGFAPLLARQFRLTPRQIAHAVRDAHGESVMAQRALEYDDLVAACRRESNQTLGDIAVKIQPSYQWEQLILPADRIERLRELCAQLQHRHRVFGDWGFGARLAHGKGLSALFTGPPGTGKTMAAEVVARELGLEIYKIDLSSVVSKYIGETEKNLSKIFKEAESSNAILFFDEADALFGKRTEVSDAHDRYANIETSYLLQKMEEYEGVVILASNLRENMDEAFVRRLRFIVDFPFPDESHRLRIWQTHFPPQAPLGADLDYALLARQLPVAGGNIKNIVLNAAFLAAAADMPIGLAQVLHAARREFEKIGKRWDDAQFAKRVPAAVCA